MKKRNVVFLKKFLIFSLLLLLVFNLSFLSACIQDDEDENNHTTMEVLNLDKSLGVWWWDKALSDDYLTFAKLNGVDEVYYCDYSPEEDTYEFVKKAKQRGIKVYLLLGEKEWLNDSAGLIEKIEAYTVYQQTYQDAQLSGIHLDIEPHQFDDFNESQSVREQYILKLIALCKTLSQTYTNITFDYDLPFWLDDEVEFGGESKQAYKYIIDYASRVYIMSYRDSAQKIASVASEEIEYAKSKNKQIFVSVEMDSSEGDNVSFKEESKEILYSELNKLKEEINYDNFGVSIHHIKTWKNLKEK